MFATLDALQGLDWEGKDPPKKHDPMPVPASYRARAPRFKARPWWHDQSPVAQRRRAVKRWHGRADALTMAFVDYRKKECRRLRLEGHSWREIGRLQGLHYTVARRHVMDYQPDPWDVAMSAVMVDRYMDQPAGVACQPDSSRRVSSTKRWWKLSPPVKYNDEWAHRARDGTWRLGPYRC